MSASSYDEAIRGVLESEGGNDDDPRDPGGRTSRGITQRTWDAWRSSHPGLPTDVWQAPQAEVLAIYRARYWNALRCDELPAGVDHAAFDFGVNSGVGRSVQFLQSLLGVEADGVIGPVTLAAAHGQDPADLIDSLCDARLSFLKGLSTWPTYGKGWTARVDRVRTAALNMAAQAPKPAPAPPPAPKVRGLLELILDFLRRLFGSRELPRVPSPLPKPPRWLIEAHKDIGFRERGANLGIEHFIEEAHNTGHPGDPWCAIFVCAKLEECSIRSTRSAMARSFERSQHFVRLPGPALGAIATFWRGSPSSGSGHVNFYAGTDENGRHIGVGGNQGDRVSAAQMDMLRHTGWWWPKNEPLPPIGAVRVHIQVADGGSET